MMTEKRHKKYKIFHRAFTLVEILITIAVLVALTSIAVVTSTAVLKSTRDSARDAKLSVLSNSLEKYYRDNGEYPSVALVTSTNVNLVKQKLSISDPDVFKFPNTTNATSLVTSNPSTTRVVYAANTTDTTKNSQCQTDVNGYCDGYTLQYIKESNGSPKTFVSVNSTFEAVRDADNCDEGDTRSGDTCTHTYAATYQAGSYSCPSGGTLSGTTCTNSYAASYASGGSYYYCPSGGSLSGSTCTISGNSYAATPTCPSGYSLTSGGGMNNTCAKLIGIDDDHDSQIECPAGTDAIIGDVSLRETIRCFDTVSSTGYSCPHGGSLSGTTCVTSGGSYPATATTSYVCPSGTSWWPGANYYLCGSSYNATYTSGGYSCSAGTLNGSQCVKIANASTNYSCPHSNDSVTGSQCYHDRAGTQNNTKAKCEANGWTWSGGSCFNYHSADSSTTYSCSGGGWTVSGAYCYKDATYTSSGYSCPSGGSEIDGKCWSNGVDANQVTTYSCPSGGNLSGTTCITSTTYPASTASYSGYYYCSGSGTLSGTTCTNTYTGTQGAGYYTCPQGGVASGSTCSYTYVLEG